MLNNILLDEAHFSLVITPVLGDNILTAAVTYAEGEQPLNSVG